MRCTSLDYSVDKREFSVSRLKGIGRNNKKQESGAINLPAACSRAHDWTRTLLFEAWIDVEGLLRRLVCRN